MDNTSHTTYDFCIEAVLDALSAGVYQKFILLDCVKDRYFYVSDSFSKLCGLPREQIYSLSAKDILHKLRTTSENDRFIEIKNIVNKLADRTEDLSLTDITASLDMNIIHADGSIHLTNYLYIPMELSRGGKEISKMLIILSLPTSSPAFNKIIVTDRRHNMIYKLTGKRWQCKPKARYTDRELQILKLAAIGKTRKEVADILCRSEETIKSISAKLKKKREQKT